jgi:endonuclease-3
MLEYNSAFELLVAVILSAQSTDEQVNRVTGELFKVCRSPQDFIAIDLEQLEILIKGAGLYKNKARNLKKMAAVLLEKHQGQVPASFDALMELPGVGVKVPM